MKPTNIKGASPVGTRPGAKRRQVMKAAGDYFHQQILSSFFTDRLSLLGSGQPLEDSTPDITCRHMRRVRERYEQLGYDGPFNHRTSQPSPKGVPLETVDPVLSLYRERHLDYNVRYFHERLREAHGITISYI